MGRENKKDAVAALHREQILKAAEKLFSKKGYVQTTIDDISKMSAYSRRTIYAYYENKEDILHHIMEKGLLALKMDIENAVNRQEDFMEGYKEICMAMRNYQREYPHFADTIKGADTSHIGVSNTSDTSDVSNTSKVTNDSNTSGISDTVKNILFLVPEYPEQELSITISYGDRMDDRKYRKLVEQILQTDGSKEKVELILQEVHSLADLLDIMSDTELNAEELELIINLLPLPALSALLSQYPNDNFLINEHEQLLYDALQKRKQSLSSEEIQQVGQICGNNF